MGNADWWRDATFYQIYVRSFADSDGDGAGDLDGVRERLGYLELLGVDVLRLTYDPVPDGDHPGFDRLVADARQVGMKVSADHASVNHRLLTARFDAVELRTAIDASLDAAATADVPPTWAVSNHDAVRPTTRYGDGPLGMQRARAMALVELGLPGAVHLYNGEELGLPDGPGGSRTPLPWEGEDPPFGFSPNASTWLAMPPEWAKLTVERQLEDADSTLSLYRQAIELRKTHRACSGDELEWYGAPAGCFAYRRRGGGLVCVLNASETTVPLPAGEVLLVSGSLNDRDLPPNTAAWLAART